MKTKILLGVLLSLKLMAYEEPTVAKLDVLKTCTTQEQLKSAQQVVTFLENFKWWKIKNIMESLHPEYQSWHGSRVFTAAMVDSLVKVGIKAKYPQLSEEEVAKLAAGVTPGEIAKLPFQNGLNQKNKVIQELAMIQYTNDIAKYKIELTRLECLGGSDTVIVSSTFEGVNVQRDPATGQALYQAPVPLLETRFTMMVKDNLIYRFIIDLSDEKAKAAILEFKAVVDKGVPNVAPGSIPDQTYAEILKDFMDQASK